MRCRDSLELSARDERGPFIQQARGPLEGLLDGEGRKFLDRWALIVTIGVAMTINTGKLPVRTGDRCKRLSRRVMERRRGQVESSMNAGTCKSPLGIRIERSDYL